MSAQLVPSQDDDNVVDMRDGPGQRLRVARQARGLEVEQVAAQLHLSPSLIAALERDDYDGLPGGVFVMGYLRNYARLVMLDPEPVLDAYRASAPESVAALPRAHPSASRQARNPQLFVGLAGLGLVLIAGALLFFWLQGQSGAGPQTGLEPMAADTEPSATLVPDEQGALLPAPPATSGTETVEGSVSAQTVTEERPPIPSPPRPAVAVEPPTASAPADTPELTAEPSAEPSPDPVTENNAEAQPEPAAAAAGPAETSADEDEPGSAAPAEGEIVMSFSGPCWVDIRDSAREFKLFGEMNQGDRHVLGGTPPYSVILGNTAAVTITVRGTPFDLQRIARGNVARFTLDPTQLP